MNQLTHAELSAELVKINSMNQEQMARVFRFAEPGHIWFSDPKLYAVFANRFAALGGMNPTVSKQIGWIKELTGV